MQERASTNILSSHTVAATYNEPHNVHLTRTSAMSGVLLWVIGQNVCLDLGVDAGQLPFFLKFLLLKQKFTRTKCVSGLL